MEERSIDTDPNKLKIRPEGEEDEIELELPESEEYDEDLVGLSPSQLEQKLKEREQEAEEARRERDKLLSEGERRLKRGEYAAAEPFFSQALLYDPTSSAAQKGVWICRTENFKNDEPFTDPEAASQFAEAEESVRKFVLDHVRARLSEERDRAEEEAAPLREKVRSAQETRRKAFLQNRRYYLIRFCAFFAAFAIMLVSCGVSAYFIVRTTTFIPVILTASFGGVSLLFLAIGVVYSRKLLVASRLVKENERLSSTEEGARLEELEERLSCLSMVLGE